MAVPSRGGKAVASLLRRSAYQSNASICSSCKAISPSQRRHHNSAAQPPTSPSTLSAAGAASEPPSISIPLTDAMPSSSDLAESVFNSTDYRIHSGVLLSRAPLLTRTQTPFENAFFLYQKRLNERLVLPYTRYFYDKPNSPADLDWKRKVRERNGVAARDVGGYSAYGPNAWNDEALVGDKTAEPESIVNALIRDAERVAVDPREKSGAKGVEEKIIPVDRPLPRSTQADQEVDKKRLDRNMEDSVYLVVKDKDGSWKLPTTELEGRENLHQAAERLLVQAAGYNMNTWIVGRVPIGHYVRRPTTPKEESKPSAMGSKTFFLKARIMAGQADIKDNALGYTDFQWLTKAEMEKAFRPGYFSAIKNMIPSR